MINPSELQNIYETAFRFFEKTRTMPNIEIEFYKYVGLRHTIRVRAGTIFVRLSDLMQDAPNVAHQALAYILIAKIQRRKIPSNCTEIYQNYASQAEVRETAQISRKQRGRKIISSAKGNFYDLDEIFDDLNSRFFAKKMPKPTLTWSTGKTFRIFGHQDAIHNTVVISQTLDDAKVPKFVVEYVLYHELLHIKHPTKVINGRRYSHTPVFRTDERKFPRYEEAEDLLEKLAKHTRRKKGKR